MAESNDTEVNEEESGRRRTVAFSTSSSRSSQNQKQTQPEFVEPIFPTPLRTFQNDTLNTEMVYYISVLQDVLPSMTSHQDRRKLVPWIKKLFSPEYQVERLRIKRNKYLLHLILVALNDRVFGVFRESPKLGGLPEISELRHTEGFNEARWEKDTYWSELLFGMTGMEQDMKCWFHDFCSENEDKGNVHPVFGALLDEEFNFFLYLIRPLLALIPDSEQKSLAAIWIFTLAKVKPCMCLTMKGLRNDYMQALLGYMQDLRLAGPFCNMPPEKCQTLMPLSKLLQQMKACAQNMNALAPNSAEVDAFINEQPVPEQGAFCYVAVTGNARAPEKVSTVPLSTTKFLDFPTFQLLYTFQEPNYAQKSRIYCIDNTAQIKFDYFHDSM